MDEKIMTQHPAGKQGVNIDRGKYETVKAAIIAALKAEGESTFTALSQTVERALQDNFDGSIPWYFTTVKLDLEARGLLERVPNSRPQRVRLSPST